jgi:CubicO group peptidase (beta-lactamase class C family)
MMEFARACLPGSGALILVALYTFGGAPALAQQGPARAAAPLADTATPAGDPRAARVDAVFAELDRAHGPGAAVAVIRDGQILLERGYGLAQLEYDVAVTPATVFHVASVSKQFAAFAVALLAQQGRLSLDDDIRTHLPEVPDLGHRVTVRHLIHHTSGIRDQWELLMMAGWRLDDVITRDQIMALMRRQRQLNFEPGAEHLYSNMGYTLLAEIVERASGTSFGDYLHTHVFEPLGMRHTHVHDDHERVVRNRAYSYRPGQGGAGWRTAVLSYANQGATSLFTTAGDLARWLHNYETARVGGSAAIAQMRERGVLNSGDTIPYAFAITRGAYRGRTTWGHSGSDAGFRAYAVHFPDERLGIVVLSNAANASPQRLAMQVADIFLGLPEATAQPALQQAGQQQPQQRTVWEPGPEQLRAYTGDYYSPELGVIYTVVLRDDALFATHHRLADTRLGPAAEDTFRLGGRIMRFERDAAGAVAGFRLTGSRVRDLAFHRMPAGALPVLD